MRKVIRVRQSEETVWVRPPTREIAAAVRREPRKRGTVEIAGAIWFYHWWWGAPYLP
jgi:hypothetical protein